MKVNQDYLEAAPGLRIGVVPTRQGRSDAVRRDEQRNMVVCPIPHDASFMQTFYEAWQVVRQFIEADALVPREAALPRPAHRQVAQYLADRRQFPVLDVIEVLAPLSQPELLETQTVEADIVSQRDAKTNIDTIIAPRAREV